MYDVIVIGGGVIGGAVLRELSRYQLKACMLEKQDDVCMGQSKANSGIVHAGFDAVPNTLKAKFNVLGNVMMPDYTAELGVKYKNNRSLVLAFSEEETRNEPKKQPGGGAEGFTGSFPRWCRSLSHRMKNRPPPGPPPGTAYRFPFLFPVVSFASFLRYLKFQTAL